MGCSPISGRPFLSQLLMAMTWPSKEDMTKGSETCDQRWSDSWGPVTRAQGSRSSHGLLQQWWCPGSLSSKRGDGLPWSERFHNLLIPIQLSSLGVLLVSIYFSSVSPCIFLYKRSNFSFSLAFSFFVCSRISKALDMSSYFTSSSFQRCGPGQIIGSRPQFSFLQNKVIQISCENEIK